MVNFKEIFKNKIREPPITKQELYDLRRIGVDNVLLLKERDTTRIKFEIIVKELNEKNLNTCPPEADLSAGGRSTSGRFSKNKNNRSFSKGTPAQNLKFKNKTNHKLS